MAHNGAMRTQAHANWMLRTDFMAPLAKPAAESSCLPRSPCAIPIDDEFLTSLTLFDARLHGRRNRQYASTGRGVCDLTASTN